MRAVLLKFFDTLRSSYWFIPSIMAVLAVVLAIGMILIDSYYGSNWINHVRWLYVASPSGARQVLSSIGGSMITVAGTVFSVTIAAVVYASGQYGPRLLTNFMKDRGNQVTLGTFIATFIYCLIVLRTVRSSDESSGYSFVPNTALLVGVILALCSIAVLIFFIHHVPSKIHINSVIEDVGVQLIDGIGKRYPEKIGSERGRADADDREDLIPKTFRREAGEETASERMLLDAETTGYIQIVDDERLIEIAHKHDLVLRLQYLPGDFIHVGRTLVEAWPPERCGPRAVKAILAAYSTGPKRSALQDLRFLIDELVEIAARALSPGVNDPFTATSCLDWLSAGLSDLAKRDLPSHLRADKNGALRVIAHPQSFEDFLERAFGSLVQYVASDMVAGLRYLVVLGEISLSCDDHRRVQTLALYVDRLETLAEQSLDAFNLARVRERAAQLRRAFAEPDFKRRMRDSNAWLGGSG